MKTALITIIEDVQYTVLLKAWKSRLDLQGCS